MNNKYILVDKKPQVEKDLIKWCKWFENADRVVKQTDLKGLKVSTVFLGLDHNLFEEGEPLLFETMIFPTEKSEDYQTRCSTWEQAEKQHEEALEWVWANDLTGEKK